MLRRRPLAGRPSEAGVVAIVVALSISTFLVGFAALAVDVGAAYTRQTDIQATAEQLAMAGAAGLPDRDLALYDVEQARTRLCAEHDLPGVCSASGNWARDGDLANGEVRFYDDRGQSGTFAELDNPPGLDPGDFLAYSAVTASGIRVVLPPSRVEFGLASALGFDGVDVTRAATARIGTPLGLGILPFALTQDDLNRGQFCVSDPPLAGYPSPPAPTSTGDLTIVTKPDSQPEVLQPPVLADDGAKVLHFTLQPLPPLVTYSNVVWHASNSTRPGQVVTAVRDPNQVLPVPRYNSWSVTVPEAHAGTIYVWATGRYREPLRPRETFLSRPAQVKFTSATPPRDTLCDQPAALLRGYLDLTRNDGGGLTTNVRQGALTKLYSTQTQVGADLLNRPLDCVSNNFATSSACVSSQLGTPFMSQVRTGLLTASGRRPGRLQGDCGQGTQGSPPGVDASHLIDGSNSGLLNRGAPSDLYDRVVNYGVNAAASGNDGIISSRALRCPRLAVMPVVAPWSVGGVARQQITRFVYVWIDEKGSPSAARGLNASGAGRPASLRGYVIEPKLFPEQVAGSPLVGPYLGGDMPRQVVLVHDLGAQGT